MTTVGKQTNGSSGASFVDSSSGGMDTTNRKIRKPLMERKRRARINHSLDELHHLLAETEFTSKGAKLEKADILEMTVQYLKRLSHSECSREIHDNLHNALLERYLLGYQRCALEMEQLLADTPDLEPPLRSSILSHLKRSLERLRTEQEEPWRGRRFGRSCSVLFGEPRDVRIVPSKLGSGEVVLLLSSKGVKCEEDLKKSGMWRPWW